MKKTLFFISTIGAILITIIFFYFFEANELILILFNLAIISMFDLYYLRLMKSIDFVNYNTMPLSKLDIFIKILQKRTFGVRIIVVMVSILFSILIKNFSAYQIIIFLLLYLIYSFVFVVIEHYSKRKILFFRLVYHNLGFFSGIFVVSITLLENSNSFFDKVSTFYLDNEKIILIFFLLLLPIIFYLTYLNFYKLVLKYPYPDKETVNLMLFK